MSERTGADAGPPVTLRAELRRWFLRPPRPHGEVIEDRRVSFLELFYRERNPSCSGTAAGPSFTP